MSELIEHRNNHVDFRWQLMTTVSALVLTAHVATTAASGAEETDRPTVWIELGGQMESVQGTSTPFVAPFMTAINPVPGPYANDIFMRGEHAPQLALGPEGRISFQPKGSDWVFSASLLYGRSSTNRHIHQQSAPPTYVSRYGRTRSFYVAAFANTKSSFDESHLVLDFSVGRDVGLGIFGRESTSVVSAGVRFAQFSDNSKINATGRPGIYIQPNGRHCCYSFYNYTMLADARRSFHGIGPSLAWNASATLLGNKDVGQLTFDWGINGAVLFGRQKAKTSHSTQAYHMPITTAYNGMYDGYYYAKVYQHSRHSTRSRAVVVPNLGGFAGLSVKYPNVQFSLGYRADFFFGAVDAGIDERHSKNLGFSGPFATISIGLGG